MAQRSKKENNPFRKAPTVAPKKPMPSVEEVNAPAVPKTENEDPNKNMTNIQNVNSETHPEKKNRVEKQKKKPGRKQTVEGGATERLVVMLNKETADKFAAYCKKRRYPQSELLREVIVKMISEDKEK